MFYYVLLVHPPYQCSLSVLDLTPDSNIFQCWLHQSFLDSLVSSTSVRCGSFAVPLVSDCVLFYLSKSDLLKWLLSIFTDPVESVICNASFSGWRFNFLRSLMVVSVIVSRHPITIGITSPSVHSTC